MTGGDGATKARPSHVFGARLRETRGRHGITQARLAELVTDAGRPLNKAAVTRIERGERGLALDEAMALAWALQAAPANLLSPSDDHMVWITEKAAVDGAGMRNWLLFGDPLLLSPEGRRARRRISYAFETEALAQALVDAKRGGDTAGTEEAARALRDAILAHHRAGEENEQ